MDALEFGEYIMGLRDARMSRPEMATYCGYHVNTIKGYEKEGRLPDVDYLAVLAQISGTSLTELLQKRLEAGKFPHLSCLIEKPELAQSNAQQIPVLDRQWSIPKRWSSAAILAGMQLLSLDMVPLIQPGQEVAFDPSDTNLNHPGIFVLELMNQLVIRYVEVTAEKITLSGGAECMPMTVPIDAINKLIVKGRVIAVLAEVGSSGVDSLAV